MRFVTQIISGFHLYTDKKTIIHFMIYFMKFYILWFTSYCIAIYYLLTQSNKTHVQPHVRTYSVLDQQQYIKLFSHVIKDTVVFLYIQLFKIVHGTAFIYGNASTWPPLSPPLFNPLKGPSYKKQKSSTSVQLSHTIKLWSCFYTPCKNLQDTKEIYVRYKKSPVTENWKTGRILCI